MMNRWIEEKRISKEDLILMVSYIMDISLGQVRSQLFRDNLPLTYEQKRDLELMIEKRAQGFPLQYAIGRWSFYGRDFLVDERALIPRPETEYLLEDVIGHLLQEPEKTWAVLDVGTGTGIIPLTLIHESLDRKAKGQTSFRLGRIVAVDISEDALNLAKENESFLADQSPHGLKYNVERPSPLYWQESDLLDQVRGPFDIIISNPPYVEEASRGSLQKELDYEPEVALFAGADGLDIYRRLIPQAYEALRVGGHVFLEIGDSQGQAVCQLLADCHFQEIDLVNDYAGFNRRVKARK